MPQQLDESRLDRKGTPGSLRCYAFASGRTWEAICTDLATRADLRAFRADLEAAIIARERRSLIAALAIAGVLFAALRLTG